MILVRYLFFEFQVHLNISKKI